MDEGKISVFLEFASNLRGSERSEAQSFLIELFKAFGHEGVIQAGARFEDPIKVSGRTKFCDLIWPGKVLIEMKKRGENLENHLEQVKEYWWGLTVDRGPYVVLCNFDEFLIYNWDMQIDPLDRVPVDKLKDCWRSLAFLCHTKVKPIFGNNLVEVTEKAANKISELYSSLILRGIEPEVAQGYTLQCLVALFAEDSDLFPNKGFFYDLIEICRDDGNDSTYDIFHGLFKQMNSEKPAPAGRYAGVEYFNGGIFNEINKIELNKEELKLLSEAAKYDWSKIQPSIFGNIFEDSLDSKDRHKWGAHFTYESDIMRIVEPTILRPWREKINSAKTLRELESIWDKLSKFKILDPACGSGNFLYIAFRELKNLELELIRKMLEKFPSTRPDRLHSKISAIQFYGIDTNKMGVELAKITLSMAKKFAADDFNKFTKQNRLVEPEGPLPFDNLDNNIMADDALLRDWPNVDAIIGNPPYQAINNMQKEFGRAYVNKIRKEFPEMPGRADYCVYWFRKAHDVLPEGGRAGLVGTNTIRQTNSKKGGLDHIVSNNGTIIEAVSTMPWSGKAVVYVSIVNWVKGLKVKGKKKLFKQEGDNKNGPWEEFKLSHIPPTLSNLLDVTGAPDLLKNKESKLCYQGQTHGHEGFLLSKSKKGELVDEEPKAQDVIFPFLTAKDLIASKGSQPSRFVIDFQQKDIYSSQKYGKTFQIIKDNVLPTRKNSYEKEKERNEEALADDPKAKINHHHKRFYDNWWLLSYGRRELISKLKELDRYCVSGRVTKRPIFEFVSVEIRPNDALMVFPFEDDYSFGVLQSSLHWDWFNERCSTLKGDPRYTSTTVFDSFAWPQWGTFDIKNASSNKSEKSLIEIALNVAKAAKELRDERNKIMTENGTSLRNIYTTLELPGDNKLKDSHNKLDKAVWDAYYVGMPKNMEKLDTLEFLLKLNELCADAEKNDEETVGPGLPSFCKGNKDFFSTDCVKLK